MWRSGHLTGTHVPEISSSNLLIATKVNFIKMLELGGIVTEQGKLQVFNQPALQQWIRASAGRDIVMSLKVKRKTRSNPQNAYYWSVVIPMVTDGINKFGNSFEQEETHEFLKAKFNAKEIEVTDGHFLNIPQSTSKMDTAEFMTYIENIQQFASMMLSIYIPSPNEQATIDYSLNQQ